MTQSKNRSPRKKPLLLAVIYSILLIVLLPICYFLVLISIKPESFPFVTKHVQDYVNERLVGNNIEIEEAFIGIKRFGRIDIDFHNIKLNNPVGEQIVLPRIEAEFSLYNFLLLQYLPSKIKIIEPTIEINKPDQGKAKIAVNGFDYQDFFSKKEYSEKVWQTFSSLRNGDIAIKEVEMENARIIFKSKHTTQNILLKNFYLKSSFHSGYFKLRTNNIISLNEHDPDIKLSGNCLFNFDEGLKCDLNLLNFIPKSLAVYNNQLADLAQVNTKLDGKIKLEINEEYKISDLQFNFNAKSGNFKYPKFFSQEMNFKNFHIDGEVKDSAKIINITNLSSEFDDVKFAMSMGITDLMDPELERIAMQFKINNAKTSDLEKLWPVFLNEKNIRKWVINHISEGSIRDAYANITMKKVKNVSVIDKVQAELMFSGLKLNYSEDFPPISAIGGIASFSEKSMKINLVSGDVLDSKIKSAIVAIDNFHAKKIMLNIDGVSSGQAADSLKHINYKSSFAADAERYFNGTSDNNFSIKLPLTDDMSLKNSYISVTSDIKNFNNDYITNDSRLIVDLTKKIGSKEFATNINLTDADIDLESFGINKKKGVSSKIAVTLGFGTENHLQLNKLNWSLGSSKISGSALMKISPFELVNLNLENNNFGNSNFVLNYESDEDSSTRKIKIIGDQLNLKPFILNPIKSDDREGLYYATNIIKINVANILLANNQNFKNLDVDLNCTKSICTNSFIRVETGGKTSANIGINKKSSNDNFSTIKGRITDISAFAKGFDITNKLIGGDAKIKARLEHINDQNVIKGNLNIDSEFSVLKNDVVEEISNQNLFSKLKDKIIDNNKTTFDNFKLEFEYLDDELNIKTLIASNYFLGITSKGKIDLSDGAVNLKGLIVPGYSLNKLFGLGNVPIIGSILVGEKGGGLFAVRYEYKKLEDQKEGKFSINAASAIVPGGVRNIFDLF